MKDHYMEYLIFKLSEAGVLNSTTVAGGRSTISLWIAKGILKLRKMLRNGYYVVNDTEVDLIIRALGQGGKGWWSYDQPDPEPERL